MKIGILTLPLHVNYGGILQNWALQQVIKRIGYEPETLSRRYYKPRLSLKVIACQVKASVSSLVRRYFFGNRKRVVQNLFKRDFSIYVSCCDKDFLGQNIDKTGYIYSSEELYRKVLSGKYDAFIVGSDQVWREEYSPSILNYFLDFLPENDKCLRIAYAASFGKSENYILKKNMQRCRELLRRFDAVSVREYEGIDILQRDFSYEKGVKVLDPTLLLPVDTYKKLIKSEDHVHEPHVAVYVLDPSEEKDFIASEVGLQLGLPTKLFSGENHEGKMQTVSQWLAEFDGADFIVTDSFHGCVFSIIFHKPFVAIANQKRGIDRFRSLLCDAGLEDRLVYSKREFMVRKDDLIIMPDYKEIDQRLASFRASSFSFLINALKKEKSTSNSKI